MTLGVADLLGRVDVHDECHSRWRNLSSVKVMFDNNSYYKKFPLHVHKRLSESNVFTTLFAYSEATKRRRMDGDDDDDDNVWRIPHFA